MDKSIAILGAGSWGTALAMQAARSGGEVMIWSHKPEVVAGINNKHKNPLHLSDLILPENVKATTDIEEITKYNHVLIAIPAQSIRKVLESLPQESYSFIIGSKGVELGSLKLMSEVVLELLPRSRISVLSGPNFACEVAKGLPSITSIATQDKDILEDLTKIFSSANFKVYPSDDVIGVQICGAAKNVIAIACGICLGSNLGENAKAAILTKGMGEIGQLVLALGGRQETILTPAGIGDLTLTCSSKTSRNMSYGISLASGELKEDKLAEGSHAAKSISELAKKHGLNLPLIEALVRAIDEPASAVQEIRRVIVSSAG